MPLIPVTTYHLEILDPKHLRPKRSPRSDIAMVRVTPPMPELNRFFYTSVGGAWWWTDRLPWTYAEWRAYLDRPELETWMLTVAGVPAGYFELERQPSPSPKAPLLEGEGSLDVEIVYFGLLPPFVGAGLGGHLLTAAIERGFAIGASRVWVHTCTLDHPQALANYQARGMVLFKEETEMKDEAERSCGPWPGANV